MPSLKIFITSICCNLSFDSLFRIILAVQSEYFDRLLYGEMSEGVSSSVGSAPIVLKDVRVSSFQLLMCFAYTGYIELKSAHLEVNN